MALDAANFIAELSITDPPGSDPLSQGDDQIRTIKRATFQSFPLVAAAVNLTDAQLNLAAIKDEANVFTAEQRIQGFNLVVDAVADAAVGMIWQRNSLSVWRLSKLLDANTNDLAMGRFDALGAFVDNPWRIDFATGVVDFAHVPTVLGAPIWIAGEVRQFVAAATPGANWFKADGTNGTVNLTGRHLMTESGFDAVGTSHNAALDTVTSAPGSTGSTAITTAQMPVHSHDLRTGNTGSGLTDTLLTFISGSGETVVAGNRNNTSPTNLGLNNDAQLFVRNAGSGAGHTHTDGGNAMVLGEPTFTNTVRPLGFVVSSFQYVP